MTSLESATSAVLRHAARRLLEQDDGGEPLVISTIGSEDLEAVADPRWRSDTIVDPRLPLAASQRDVNMLMLCSRGGSVGPDDVLPILTQMEIGRRVVVVTPRAWAPGAGEESRQQLIDAADVVLVVEVDARDRQQSVTLAGFERRAVAAQPAPTRFMRLASDELSDSIPREVDELIKRAGGTTPHGYVRRIPLDPTLPLSFDDQRVDPAKDARRRKQHSLANLFGIARGPAPSGASAASADSAHPRILDPSNLLAPVLGDIRRRAASPVSTDALLKTGDICVSTTRARTGPLLVRAIAGTDPPLVADDKLLVLRAKETLSDRQIVFVAKYLASQHVASLLNSRTRVGNYLALADIADLPVPASDEALLSTLDDLNAARTQLRAWADEVQTATERVLAYDDAAGGTIELRSTGQLLRQRVVAARQLDDRGYRFRSMFPLPVALPYRQAQTAPQDHGGYHQVLRCVETFTGYLAMLSIILARSVGVDLSAVREVQTKLATRPQGVTIGDWTAIVREVSGKKVINRVDPDGPLRELCELTVQGSPVSELLSEFAAMRNDFAHNRGPAGSASASAAFTTALSMLDEYYGACEWLCDYPVRLVEHVAWDSYSETGTYRFRELVGDHHLVKTRTADTPSPDLNAGRLYVVDRTRNLHLLSPLVQWQECDACSRPAAFFLDRFDPVARSCSLRAMDHGHSIERSDVVVGLTALGLLPPENWCEPD